MNVEVDVTKYHHFRAADPETGQVSLADNEELTGEKARGVDGRLAHRVLTHTPGTTTIRLPEKEILDVMAQNIFRNRGPRTFSEVLSWYLKEVVMPEHTPGYEHVTEVRGDHPAVDGTYTLTPGEQEWLNHRVAWYRALSDAHYDASEDMKALNARMDLTGVQKAELAAPIYERYDEAHIPWDDVEMDKLLAGEEVTVEAPTEE